MTKIEHSASVAIRGTQGSPQTPQAPPAPTQEQRQALQDAARQLREAIRQNIDAQRIDEQANAEAAKALRDQGVVVKTPTVPPLPAVFGRDGQITIQGSDGKKTVIGMPGAAAQGIPPEAVDISIAFFFTVAAIIILLPLARAIARKMDRRSVQQIPPEVSAQLEHLNHAVDAIALEVERISEGQRFTTRLLTEQREAAPSLTTGANR